MENDSKASFREGSSMGFLDHLEELRRRLLKSIFAVIVLTMIAFYFSDQLMELIKIPLHGQIQLYNIQVTGSFYAYLKISVIAGVLASLPVIFYQMWMFVSPGLYRREKALVAPLVLISTLLFLVGASFCFLVVLPISFDFLISFSGESIVNTITIGSYISFSGLMLMAFGFGFQLPILAYFLGRMGIVKPELLVKGRRYAVIIVLVVGAILTPPDAFTQLLLAGPLYVLYEISILVVKATHKGREPTRGGPIIHIFWIAVVYLVVVIIQGGLIVAGNSLASGPDTIISDIIAAIYALHFPAVMATEWLQESVRVLAHPTARWIALAFLGLFQWLIVYTIFAILWRLSLAGSADEEETES